MNTYDRSLCGKHDTVQRVAESYYTNVAVWMIVLGLLVSGINSEAIARSVYSVASAMIAVAEVLYYSIKLIWED